jgi:glucokinase
MYALGMDIGGTNTVFGIVNSEGTVIGSDSVKTQEHPDLDEYVSTVSSKIKALMQSAGITFDDIAGLGIGAPNASIYTGTIEKAPNLPWKGESIPLADLFSKQLSGIPVKMTNDANAAALGEMAYGVAKGLKHFIMITLGTGVGSGIVIDGKMVYGKDGFAGELGHLIIDRSADARLCGCGRRGCLETYCSATGMIRTARERLQGVTINGSKDVYDLAMQGNADAIAIFNETGKRLGQALADMVVFSSPEAFVFFGGLAKSGELLLKPTREAMEESMMPVFKGKTKLLVSTLKDADAAVLGASALIEH